MDQQSNASQSVRVQLNKEAGQVLAIGVVLALVAGIIIGVVGTKWVSADNAPNRNLIDNVQEGRRNGQLAWKDEQEICFLLKSRYIGGRPDDYTSCVSLDKVLNLDENFLDGVFAGAVTPTEDQEYSVGEVSITGGESGIVIGAPVPQLPAQVETPTAEASPTVPVPVIEPQQPTDLPETGGS